MRCRFFVSVLVSFLAFSFFGFSVNDVYAVEDLTVSYSAGQTLSSDPMFPDCDKTCYEDYNYLHIQVSNPDYSNMSSSQLYARFVLNNYITSFSMNAYLDSYIDVSGLYELRYYGNWGTSLTNITFTLIESLPSRDCPVCEECQACPVIPDNPYDDKFDKIITAIYVCAATILVVYFFYCIYRMIIKTTGSV